MTLSFKKNPIVNEDEKKRRHVERQTSTNTTATVTGSNQDSYLNGIGSYEFIKSLGNGKFSRVMLAYHLETHQQVAIKVRPLFKCIIY